MTEGDIQNKAGSSSKQKEIQWLSSCIKALAFSEFSASQ